MPLLVSIVLGKDLQRLGMLVDHARCPMPRIPIAQPLLAETLIEQISMAFTGA